MKLHNRSETSKSRKFGNLKVEKHGILFSERRTGYKYHSLKLLLLIVACCTVLSLLYSTPAPDEIPKQPNSRSQIIEVGIISNKTTADLKYRSDSVIHWALISNILAKLPKKSQNLKIGILNFDSTEISHWQQISTKAKVDSIHLDYAKTSITWEDIYPEWIDEEEENEVPACPSLPEPQVYIGSKFDLIAVKLPCNKLGNWSRDVARLHLQLTAAKLAASASKHRTSKVHVLFVTECLPTPNLFTCKSLVEHKGNVWLYKSNFKEFQKKLQLPIVSCELAVRLKSNALRPYKESGHQEAYVTILHSADFYVCGAIVAAKSIRLTGSTRDLVILVDKSISNEHKSGLEEAGWKVKTFDRIRNPKAHKNAYNAWNYSKFRLWQLTDYSKIIFIDADLLILKNIDFLFELPEISATGNDASLFNSGVMVIEPSNCTFKLLMEHIKDITSYNGGDQGYLNEIFTWWHRIPKYMNFLKHFWIGDSEETKAKKIRLYASDPPDLYVLHYLGLKPWQCFRDYDCNFNSKKYRDFASDEAHATWWKVHDTMPDSLQQFCLLSSYRKAHLEFNRRKAEKNNFADRHWSRNIIDPRKDICNENSCNWKSILAGWRDVNSLNKLGYY